MTTVLTTTTTKRRDPLTTINMATTQARPVPSAGGSGGGSASGSGAGKGRGRRANETDENANKLAERKRKPGYDEDVEGFQFSRLPAKKARSVEPTEDTPATAAPPAGGKGKDTPKRGRPAKRDTNTALSESRLEESRPEPRTGTEGAEGPAPKRKKGRPSKSKPERNGFVSPEPDAKITLPMADTPVMQRNKDMRTAAKSEKGNRRSSLGMRGRRASSLIDSGASNALPHKEVGTADFYKHIAPDLPEPRRMRQLLIWCATRAIGHKPSGSRSEDHSARLAARVIQEELLKDFESNSDLSNWFGREDEAPPAVVVKKPHPKNVQNTEKIRELEEQIQRLQKERQSLNALLRPPSVPRIKQKPDTTSSTSTSQASQINPSHLDPSQQPLLSLLQPRPQANSQPSVDTPSSITPAAVSSRLSRLTDGLGPTIDTLASGVHDIELYRAMSDRVSARVLHICAERLDERDARNAAHWLGVEGEGDDNTDKGTRSRLVREKPREDLGVILGALSRVERR